MRGATALSLMMTAALVASAGAAPPTSRRAEAPAVRSMLADLADRDAAVREEARLALLGLARQDLPLLRDAVARSRPLLPAQASALHEIVMHVYLAGEAYESVEADGFLGLTWTADFEAPARTSGVVVHDRIPGFVAFRFLREGDVILSIAEHPLPQLPRDEFIRIIRDCRAGQTLELEVLRQGRVQQVRLTLNARPAAAVTKPMMDEFSRAREERAEAYWQEHFAPLLRDDYL